MNFRELFFTNTTIRQTIFKNMVWLFGGYFVSLSLKFILTIYAARILGAAGYGGFAFVLSALAFTFVFSDVGINTFFVREYARGMLPRASLLSTALYLKLLLLLLSVALSIAVRFVFYDSAVASVFWLLLILYVADTIRDFLIVLARAHERMQLESIVVAGEALLTMILGVLFLVYKGNILGLAYAYALAALLSLCAALVLWRSYLTGVFSFFNRRLAATILIYAWPFVFGAIIDVYLTQVDIVMLGWLKGNREVGYYSVGARLVQVLFGVSILIARVIFPVLSRFPDNKEKIAAIVQRALSAVTLLVFPIVIGGMVISSRLIPVLFGGEFYAGVRPFSILLLVFGVFSITIIFDCALMSLNFQRKNIIYTALSVLLNVVLNLFFVVRWGAFGAAVATLIAQCVNFALTARLIKSVVPFPLIPGGEALRYGVAAILIGIFLRVLYPLPLPILLACAVFLYILLLRLMHAPLLQDLKEIAKGFSRKMV